MQQIVYTVFSSVVQWFETTMQKTGMLSTWLGGVFIIMVVRVLLKPFFGMAINSGISDTIKQSNQIRNRKGGE